MKPITIIGILLIVFGVFVLGYHGINYTKTEPVMQFGDVKITNDEQKHVYFPPVLGAGALLAGLALVVIGRKR